MKCHVCGSQMQSASTTLPFKVSETSVAILKALPVLQCTNCSQYLLEDAVMVRVEEILAAVDQVTELEVIQFAE